ALSRRAVAAPPRRDGDGRARGAAGHRDPRCARRGDRGRRPPAPGLFAGQWRTRLFPAPLGGLRARGRTVPGLHLRRGGAPHHSVRALDLLLREEAAVAVSGASRETYVGPVAVA